MNRPLITVVDTETGETITREMNDIEYAEWLATEAQLQAAAEQAAQEAATKAQAEAKLEALGLTSAELAALGL